MKKILLAIGIVLTVILGVPAAAPGDGKVGVVLLHGKWGKPDGFIAPLVSALTDHGVLVSAPEMPWSGAREYDKDMEQAMVEVDNAITELRRRGANKIVVGGHSMGAAGALHYAARTKVDGLMVIALGHYPDSKKIREVTDGSVIQATKMIAAGKGDERGDFEDFNTGNKRMRVSSPARSYLSYFDPDGAMVSTRNAARVQPGTQVLWVTPSREEPGPLRSGNAARNKLPSAVILKSIEVDADHVKAPAAAVNECITWLETLH